MHHKINWGLISLMILCVIHSACDTQNTVDPGYNNFFVKYYGEDGQQEGVDLIVNANDQSMILLGSTYLSTSQTKRIFLVKVNWTGDVIWQKKIGALNDDPKDIEPANGGGYIILAETVGINNNLDVKLIKMDANGIATDSVTYGSPPLNGSYANEYPKTVTPVHDGYIVTGTTEFSQTWASETNKDISDAFQYRFTEDLSAYGASWGDEYTHTSDEDGAIKTVQLRDNRFYVFGYSLHSMNGSTGDDLNFWYYPKGVDPNSNGNTGTIGRDETGYNERLYAVCPAFSNNGYCLVGTYSGTGSESDMYIVELTESGGELYSGGGSIISIMRGGDKRRIVPVAVCQSQFNGSGYLIVGNEGSGDSKNIWLSKIRNNTVVWSSSFGGITGNNDRAGAVTELPDGKILILGTVNLELQNLKMTLIKLNSDGKLTN